MTMPRMRSAAHLGHPKQRLDHLERLGRVGSERLREALVRRIALHRRVGLSFSKK